MKIGTVHNLEVNGRKVDYRVVSSKTARRLRVKVGLDGIEVVRPRARSDAEAEDFLRRHEGWVGEQVEKFTE